jgi:hypothetical protein
MTDARAKALSQEICRVGFEQNGVVGFARTHGIELSAAQQQRPDDVRTEMELLVGIKQRVADPFGYAFDAATEGCVDAYYAWVNAGRPRTASGDK